MFNLRKLEPILQSLTNLSRFKIEEKKSEETNPKHSHIFIYQYSIFFWSLPLFLHPGDDQKNSPVEELQRQRRAEPDRLRRGHGGGGREAGAGADVLIPWYVVNK